MILDNEKYMEDVHYVAGLDLPWEKLVNHSVMITGATGLIGSFLVDVLMYKNINDNLSCTLYPVSRTRQRAGERFSGYLDRAEFQYRALDINAPLTEWMLELPEGETVDYMIHLASNTHPVAYATDPIGTIYSNIIGTANLLEFAHAHNAIRCAFASSNEIYGENRGDVELFDESYCGYIASNTLRAGYPESKRCGEALCQAYIRQKGMDIVIPRLTRSYGPTMLMSDTKAISQFIRKAVAGEDIVLKSEGMQYYSYTYMADAVAGLLYVLLKGGCGEAYNISDESSDIRLKDLAQLLAETSGKNVVFELPDELERAGYSTATVARLDGSKLRELGFSVRYDIKGGITRTVEVLKELQFTGDIQKTN
jgi:nucleoside-diphosphate-sugar epimerase